MARKKTTSLSAASMLSIALAVSTSCAQIASSAPQVAEIVKPGAGSSKDSAREMQAKVRLRDSMKSAAVGLRELRASLERSADILLVETEHRRELLLEHPFGEVINALRELELTFQPDSPIAVLPVIGDEYKQLRRQLAQVRSLATRIEVMIYQRLNTPDEIDGEASAEGLEALAKLATDRLHRLAS